MNRTGAAGAALVLAAVAAQAGAVELYGGGASLPAPYVRISGDCWGNKDDLYSRTASGSPLSVVTYPDFSYTNSDPAKSFDCATQQVNPNSGTHYISTGSGRGIEGYISHDPNRYLSGATYPAGVTPFPSVQFSNSDAALSQTQISAWTNGGTDVQGSVDLRPVGVADDPANANDYPNPQAAYGSIIQVPYLLTGVAIAFDPTYKIRSNANGTFTNFRFNLNGGKLKLSRHAYCQIFNGQITDWTDPELTALNGGISLKATSDTAVGGIPLTIVGRSDSSGTTSLWTRNLAKVCGDLAALPAGDPNRISSNHYNNASQTLGANGGVVTLADDAAVTNDEYASGNEGVSAALDTDIPALNNTLTNGRVGYVGPDFLARFAATGTPQSGYGLVAATIENAAGTFVTLTPATTGVSFAAQLPPQSNTDGSYNATAPGSRANPADWVGKPDKSDPLADPSAATGYPIMGSSNLLLYSCYSNLAKRSALVGAPNAAGTMFAGYLNWYYTGSSQLINDPAGGILAKSGFAPVPPSFRRAILQTFIYNTNGLNLNINAVGQGACTAPGLIGA